MKLSIITINYNNVKGLRTTIESILSQSFYDKEWIVIDGGSTDGSKELILEYAKFFSYFCCEKDKGIWDALNKGISKAKGTYLNFMNSGDTYADKNTLSSIFNHNLYGDIIYGNTLNIYKDKELKITHPSEITLSFLCNKTINHQSAFISNKLQKKFYYDSNYKYTSDRKFWIQAALDNATFQYINLDIAKYDCNGISSKNLKIVQQEHQTIIKEIIPEIIYKDIIQLNTYINIQCNYPILNDVYNKIQRKGLHSILRFILRFF